jgi:Leucine-rich repeat (LRR) protein
MNATQKGDFQRRGRSAEPALLIVSLLSLFLTAQGAECKWESGLPCTFGPCSFSTDASGVLYRTGSCPDQQGTLYLTNKGIKALRDGVFNNMGACRYLYLSGNKLSHLPETIFRGLTNSSNLHGLYLDRNLLSNNLPKTIFSGLTSLRSLMLDSNQLSSLPETIFRGLTSLDQICLRDNRLSDLPETIFRGLKSLG